MSQLLDRIAALPHEKRAALAEMLRPAPEPIAIVGLGCRFPGADSPAAFWELLENGRDLVTEVPRERWDVDAYYDPDPDMPGKVASRWGSFVDGVDHFDAHFFGISAHEAARMDPHQRVLLEVAWEALEHGGIDPSQLARTATGVFVGAYHSDFSQLALADPARIDLYSGTGISNNVLAGRLAYFLDTRGPAVVVDTACSSGLVAVQLACQSLRNRDCDVALAGGVTLLLTPISFVMASRMGLMARDGRCKTFDARADGIVMGDGCGVVVMKRLASALKDGDRLLAVIRGVAVNQDGRTNGLTAPNVLSQQTLLRSALTDGGVSPDSITCIEAHGTGTSLGDPIEIEALARVVGQPRPAGGRCAIGSVKTNVGHLGAAAGMAGLIKCVLSLQHQRIVPHLNFRELNPNISLAGTPFYVPLRAEPWPADNGPRRAGVSAFGWSGTNAHVVLEEAPAVPPSAATRPRHVLFLSAMKPSALRALAARYERYIDEHPSQAAGDVCHTAAAGRAHFPHRLAVEGSTLAQIGGRLASFLSGESGRGIRSGDAGQRPPSTLFLFTGQGSQYVGMGRQLYATEPLFRRELDRCDALLAPRVGRSIVAVMHGADGEVSLEDTRWSQPALFALGWSLAALWRSWGVMPAAVLGHSVGELVAACVAGVFGLEDGVALVAARARIVQALPANGAMAAVFASDAHVAPIVARHAATLAIAAINGPTETVISGDVSAVRAAIGELASAGIQSRQLAVSHAFHSPLMEPALDELERTAATLRFDRPTVPVISSITGALADEREIATAGYWRRQLRAPVRFSTALVTAATRGHDVFLEVGPAPTLTAMARRCLPEGTVLFLESLDRDKDDSEQVLGSLGAWYARGGDVNFRALDADCDPRRVTLPTYAFQRDRYALPGEPDRRAATAAAAPDTGDVFPLSRLQSPALQDAVYECRIGPQVQPYLNEHRVYGSALLPMTGHIAMALLAAADALGPGADTVTDLLLQEPMLFADDDARVAQVVIRREPGGSSFQIYSRAAAADADWVRHMSGRIQTAATSSAVRQHDLRALSDDCALPVDVDAFYRWLAEQGLEYGSAFRGLRQLRRGEGRALGRVELPQELRRAARHHRAHPAQLDACDQVFAAALPAAAALAADSDIYLPLSVERIRIARALPDSAWSYCRLRDTCTGDTGQTLLADIDVLDEAGIVVAEVHGLLLKRAPRAALTARRPSNEWHYELQWDAAPGVPPGASPRGTWIVVADDGGAAAALVVALKQRGESVVMTDVRADWRERRQTDGDAIAGVVHMAGLDVAAQLDDDTPALLDAMERGYGDALQLLQAVVEEAGTELPPVWLVTRGAQPVGRAHGPVAAAQAPLWGLGRTVALEYPALRCTLVDLDPAGDAVDPLVEELLGASPETQVAFRSGCRLVARLVRAEPGRPDVRPIRGDATYLVTGGLAGIGLRTARWLVERGARHIVLVGRREASDAAARDIRAMEQRGARIVAARADVSRAAEITAVLDDISRTLPPLAGVFHCAGVIDDGTLPQQHVDRFARVVAPKAAGALHLHALTRHLALDCFVSFSSIAALFGSPGQANYSAANAFLDALAHHRRAHGQAALSINWGAWSDTGMASRLTDTDRRRLSDRGLGQMSPEHALEALDQALQTDAAQVAIVPVDWSRFLSQFAGAPPRLYEHLTPRRMPTAGPTADWPSRMAACAPAQRLDLLRTLVAEEAVTALGLDPAQPLDADRSLYEVGLNSLIALDLARALAACAGRTLPPTMLFNYTTVATIAAYLAAEVFALEPAPAATAAAVFAGAAPVLADRRDSVLQLVEDLSDEDVDRLLAAKARR